MPIDSYFIFNGTRSDDMGLLMASDPVSVHPARRGELFPIPGRNGSIVREDGSYDTYTITYDVMFDSGSAQVGVYTQARDVAAWLLGSRGFCRLEDSFESEHYRLARCAASLNVENRLLRFGRAQIAFEVQPQRYLKSGETPLTFTGGSTTSITNPTQFEARPLLKFTDTSRAPDFVNQTLTMRNDYYIDRNGNVLDVSADASRLGYKVSNPVNCQGKMYVRITGNGYSFLDANGNPYRNYRAETGSINWNSVVMIVPSGAVSVCVSADENGTAALALRDPRPNPGASAVTINDITVNLDFSEQDTIYLDCDLHDAYYADGSNANQMVSFSSSVTAYPTFPGLSPGANTIRPNDGAILNFTLTPRWWTL